MTQEELAGSQVSRFLVHERDLRPTEIVRAVCRWLQIDHRDPAVDKSRVLARADVIAAPAAARKQPIISAPSPPFQPGSKRLSRRLGDFEWNWPSRLPIGRL